jgi:hypothetical protein
VIFYYVLAIGDRRAKLRKTILMSNNLSRIIEFAQSTGDKLIITDKEGKEPVVVMPFEMYEHLIKIGRKDTGVNPNSSQITVKTQKNLEDELPDFDDLALEVDVSEPEIEPKEVREQKHQSKKPVPKQESPTLAKNSADEEPPEEEQFYLEPVQ